MSPLGMLGPLPFLFCPFFPLPFPLPWGVGAGVSQRDGDLDRGGAAPLGLGLSADFTGSGNKWKLTEG